MDFIIFLFNFLFGAAFICGCGYILGKMIFLLTYEVLMLKCIYGRHQAYFIKKGCKFLFKQYDTRWPELSLDEETVCLLIELAKESETHKQMLIAYTHPIPENGIKRFFEIFDLSFIGRFLKGSPRIDEILGYLVENPSKESIALISLHVEEGGRIPREQLIEMSDNSDFHPILEKYYNSILEKCYKNNSPFEETMVPYIRIAVNKGESHRNTLTRLVMELAETRQVDEDRVKEAETELARHQELLDLLLLYIEKKGEPLCGDAYNEVLANVKRDKRYSSIILYPFNQGENAAESLEEYASDEYIDALSRYLERKNVLTKQQQVLLAKACDENRGYIECLAALHNRSQLCGAAWKELLLNLYR